jgi:hypothetical protein
MHVLNYFCSFGKQRPKLHTETRSEIYSSIQNRSHPIRASEKSLSKTEHIERLQSEAALKNTENNSNDRIHSQQRNESSNHNGAHSRQSSSDRVADGEDRLVGGPRGSQWAPPYRHPPSRTSPNSHTVSQVIICR